MGQGKGTPSFSAQVLICINPSIGPGSGPRGCAHALGIYYQQTHIPGNKMAASYPSRALCVLVLIGPLLMPANAKLVSYNFTASIDGLNTDKVGEAGPASSLNVPSIGTVSLGDVINGTLTYDSLSRLVSSFFEFTYETRTDVPTLTYSVGNTGQQISTSGPQSIDVDGGETSFIAFYARSNFGPQINHFASLYFLGGEPGILQGSRLPEHLSIDDFPTHRIYINWTVLDAPGYIVSVDAEITSFTANPAIPEPNVSLLTGAGLGIFGCAKLRFKKPSHPTIEGIRT